jgi:hypothetical protein
MSEQQEDLIAKAERLLAGATPGDRIDANLIVFAKDDLPKLLARLRSAEAEMHDSEGRACGWERQYRLLHKQLEEAEADLKAALKLCFVLISPWCEGDEDTYVAIAGRTGIDVDRVRTLLARPEEQTS